ncbi:hypothetical protein P152DRAFT_455112 [Eremomyces bilateralis CBS 781.70]|uniref:Uncharacterized protein n=1 Tax=Eremomyces bilateralis CBS 781.70 TaxID=1392243 RepID=A0A6G1GBD3_9PEZI|nr:uncharacterized protein P152DRAFT_455112 [Eremomyces bilateralis CBS 781.70]KAF1815407.1 hypothetical protein P152DRAFT_455112 [Eremomyces bilateralis CBS 781.70]
MDKVMERPVTQNRLASGDGNGENEGNFVGACISDQDFGECLVDTDTDTDNSTLPLTRRWAWYCKPKSCPDYFAAWSCKSNFLPHLYETPIHREDATSRTREGHRNFAKTWREETAYNLSELKNQPSEGDNDTVKEMQCVVGADKK